LAGKKAKQKTICPWQLSEKSLEHAARVMDGQTRDFFAARNLGEWEIGIYDVERLQLVKRWRLFGKFFGARLRL